MRLQFSDGGELRRLACARWFPLALGLLVFLITARVYAPAADFDFVMFDDDINIYQNPHLGDLTPSRIAWAFTDSTYMHRFMPLAWLSLCAMVSSHGFDPAAYHVANIALHALNAVLVFALLVQILRLVAPPSGDRSRGDAGPQILAAIAALFWSLHPLRVELVGWASGILYLEATFWALLSALLFVLRLRQMHSPARGLLLAFSIAAYAASVLTYPVALGLPVGLLACAWWHECRSVETPRWQGWQRTLGAIVPFVALAGFGIVAAIHSEKTVQSYWQGLAGMDRYPLAARLAHAAYSAWYHVASIGSISGLSPVNERFMDAAPTATIFVAAYFGCGVALVVLALCFRRAPGLVWWTLAYVGVSAPFYGLLDVTFAPTDRYTYLSGIVMVLGIAVAIRQVTRLGVRWALIGVFAVAVGFVGFHVGPQLEIWRDSRSLFRAIVARAKLPKVQAAYLAREATAEAREGRFERAEEILNRVRALGEDSGAADYFEGIVRSVRNLSLQAESPPPRPRAVDANVLAIAMVREGNYVAADAFFRRAIGIDPNFAAARFNYALLLARSGKLDLALGHYSWLVSRGRLPVASERRLLEEIADAAKLRGAVRVAAACQVHLSRLQG